MNTHFDHNAVEKVTERNSDCLLITQNESIKDGKHSTFDLGFAVVEAVEAGYNQYHDGFRDRVRKLISLAMKASAAIMIVGTVLYETIPDLLLRIFSATDEMLEIGVPAFRIIGITLIISGVTIMMSGVFRAMNSSGKALAVSIVQTVTLVGSAALLALTGSIETVWFSFPISKERIVENLNASEVTLTDTEFAELEAELNKCRVYGHRVFSR